MKIEDIIKQKLMEEFAPSALEVINESGLHAGHAGDDGSGQTHFRVLVVSEAFDGLSRVERHKKINAVLNPLFSQGLHALSILAKTDEEFPE